MRRKGFLLVGLIILTALAMVVGLFYYTTSNPRVTTNKLFLPKSTPDRIKPLVTLLISAEKIYGYIGNNLTGSKEYSLDAVRLLLNENKKQLVRDSLFVVIVPSSDATYQATVDMLQEMTVNEIRNYSMREPSEDELALLKNLTTTNDR